MHKIITLLLISMVIFGLAHTVRAGFGISPPFLESDYLTPGAHFEQKIMLVRSEAGEERFADIRIRVPGAEDWISIRDGEDGVHMPNGVRRVPMIIQVDVPRSASVGSYEGGVDVIIKSSKDVEPGTVGISVGAKIDVRLGVTEEKIYSFHLRGVNVDDLETARKWLWFYFPGRIMFHMQVENTGNQPYGPSKVELDIYDSSGKRLLEKIENTNFIKNVLPYQSDVVTAILPTRLAAGSYKIHYRVFNGDDIIQENDMRLGILPTGALTGYAGYGFAGLHAKDKVGVGSMILALIAAIVWAVRYVMYVRQRLD